MDRAAGSPPRDRGRAGSPEQNPAAAEAENEAEEPIDPEVRAEVELVLADAREQIIGHGREPTLSDVVQQAMQARTGPAGNRRPASRR